MKGAVAAMVQVALAYARTGTNPPVTLQFAFVSDEETGGDAGLTTLLETTEFDPDACVVGETTARDGRYSVSVADRENIWLTADESKKRSLITSLNLATPSISSTGARCR